MPTLYDVIHKLDLVLNRIAEVETLIRLQKDATMSALDDLATQVAANAAADASAVILIQGIAAQLSAAATDPAKVEALSAQLKASATALAAAVVANTPAAPVAPPPAPAA